MHTHPTLDNLYLGNINPNENLKPAFSDYKEVCKESVDLENKVIAKMDDDNRALFHAMQNACGDVSLMEVRQAFITGFRLGANIMIETLGVFTPNEP